MNKRQIDYVLNKLQGTLRREQQKMESGSRQDHTEKLYDDLKKGKVKLKSKKEALKRLCEPRYLTIQDFFVVPEREDKVSIKLKKMRAKILEIEDILVLGDSKDALQIIADFNKEFGIDA